MGETKSFLFTFRVVPRGAPHDLMLVATQMVHKIELRVNNLEDLLSSSEYGEGGLFHLERVDPMSF
jgi:hypothetical protein